MAAADACYARISLPWTARGQIDFDVAAPDDSKTKVSQSPGSRTCSAQRRVRCLLAVGHGGAAVVTDLTVCGLRQRATRLDFSTASASSPLARAARQTARPPGASLIDSGEVAPTVLVIAPASSP